MIEQMLDPAVELLASLRDGQLIVGDGQPSRPTNRWPTRRDRAPGTASRGSVVAFG